VPQPGQEGKGQQESGWKKLMIEAARTSETLVNFYLTTRRNIPEDWHLRIIALFTVTMKWDTPSGKTGSQ
jgi:hypothetical protein